MNTVLATPSWLTTCLAESNAKQDWLRALQLQAGEAFLKRGIPTRKEELWKYTDATTLEKRSFTKSIAAKNSELKNLISSRVLPDSIAMVFHNGYFVPELSDLNRLPKEVVLLNLEQAFIKVPDIIKNQLQQASDIRRFPFAVLNTALLTDGMFLQISKKINITDPIHLLYINTQNNVVSAPRNIVISEESSEVTIFEEHIAYGAENYFTNAVTEITTNNNAQVHYYKIQNDAPAATHISRIAVEQKQDSFVKLCQPG